MEQNNPDNGYNRLADDEGSYDVTTDYWTTYTYYTRKFWMSVYDSTIDDCNTGACSRSFGVLADNWLGYSDLPKPLYVLSELDGKVNSDNPITVNAGQ